MPLGRHRVMEWQRLASAGGEESCPDVASRRGLLSFPASFSGRGEGANPANPSGSCRPRIFVPLCHGGDQKACHGGPCGIVWHGHPVVAQDCGVASLWGFSLCQNGGERPVAGSVLGSLLPFLHGSVTLSSQLCLEGGI
jgi:hypothetical protein